MSRMVFDCFLCDLFFCRFFLFFTRLCSRPRPGTLHRRTRFLFFFATFCENTRRAAICSWPPPYNIDCVRLRRVTQIKHIRTNMTRGTCCTYNLVLPPFGFRLQTRWIISESGVAERGNMLRLHILRVAKSAQPSCRSLAVIFDRLLVTFVATQLLQIIAEPWTSLGYFSLGGGDKL